MGAHVLLPLAFNSKSEHKRRLTGSVSSPQLGFEPATFGTLVHLPDHSAKSHPHNFMRTAVAKQATAREKLKLNLKQTSVMVVWTRFSVYPALRQTYVCQQRRRVSELFLAPLNR
jgi:hypothetical protein